MKYALTTLTPIHIGSGDQISNWSYGYEEREKTISIYNFDKVVKALKNNPQRLLNLSAKIERYSLNESLGTILKNYKLNINPEYKVKLKGEIRNHRDEYKHIWEFIKENGKVYIPGTEIKGAIRTALFYKILKDKFKEDSKLKEQFLKEYKKCLENGNYNKKDVQKEFKKMSLRWENFIFRGDFDENDAKKDILKILLISDSNLKEPQKVLEVKDITAFGVSRHFEEPHELVKEKATFLIDIKPSASIRIGLENSGIPQNLTIYPKRFAMACRSFSKILIEEEISYYKKLENPETEMEKQISSAIKKDNLKKILNTLQILGKLNQNKNFILLRLGKHQGFLSTTINLLVKEIDPKLYAQAYEYLVHKGYSEFPNKSRKITIDNELLGWCVLIPQQ